MAALGFSLNSLSLFGLVLSIGIVVDDAIVVVENVERWIEQGLSPKEAARKAMDEVGGAIVSIAVVLTAVFVPTALISGLTGQFYRQFALTIAVATLISAFNSLTLSPALAALLIKNRDEFAWGFPCRDIRFLIRALIEIVPLTSMVIQDITDLVDAGYYEETDRVCDASLLELKGDYSINSRIILLTEGSTDKDVLKEALELLFPHLADYYSFMDLAVRAPGGAGSLVHVVKSFAGAGIENRIIALFDNDAAGHSAASVLQNVPLPHNIRVMTYPDIGLASQYLTSGPSGIAIQDINGSACGIELYFGRDVLVRDGGMIPVKWKGFEDRVQRYQGEIQEKDSLKMAFLQKVKTAKSSGLKPPPGDWDEMRELLEAIFDTFAREPFE